MFVPAEVEPVDGYEIPYRVRYAVQLRNPADTFPYGTTVGTSLDLDHTVPYLLIDEGGPPGQTRPGNLGPLTRTPHRAATVGRWHRRQPQPGTFLWRSPHGWVYVVTNQRTQALGNTGFVHAVWHAATPGLAATA